MSRLPHVGAPPEPGRRKTAAWPWLIALAAAVSGGAYYWWDVTAVPGPAITAAALPPVSVSHPLARNVDEQIGFLGRFSAVDRVELRAQVGGMLTEIHFADGQLVRKGDLLFVIDTRPYEIKLAQADASLKSAQARFDLAAAELQRAQTLRRSEFGTAETVDQRQSEVNAAQGAIDDAKAQIRDAQFDLEHCRIVAPFSGRIGAHLPSVGSLISGSRFAAGSTTLLAVLVSLDPIHLDFDMSEADYLTFTRKRAAGAGSRADSADVTLGDEDRVARHGTLEFIDNALDPSSGTMHARAIVANHDLFLAPGEFARIRLPVAPPLPSLLVPDASVVSDQSQHVVMTVSPEGVVTPKPVETGDLRDGLRIIKAGLNADDQVIVGGLMHAPPGTKVQPHLSTVGIDAPAPTKG